MTHPFEEEALDGEPAVEDVADEEDWREDHERHQGPVAQVLDVHAGVALVEVVLKFRFERLIGFYYIYVYYCTS